MNKELRADLVRDAENMENGMIHTGRSFREPVDRTTRERILWALCKAFYDVIIFILKHDKEE